MLEWIKKSIKRALGVAVRENYKLGAEQNLNVSGHRLTFRLPDDLGQEYPVENRYNPIYPQHRETGSLLLQKWWEVKKFGLRNRPLGAVMLTMNLFEKPNNTLHLLHQREYDLTDRRDFLMMLDESLHRRYANKKPNANVFHLPELFFKVGEKIHTAYRETTMNQQIWTSYSIAGPNALTIVGHALPINQQMYLDITFAYAPNDDTPPRQFLTYAYKITDKIESTLRLDVSDSEFRATLKKNWPTLNTEISSATGINNLEPSLQRPL